jgi:hypothetical protein
MCRHSDKATHYEISSLVASKLCRSTSSPTLPNCATKAKLIVQEAHSQRIWYETGSNAGKSDSSNTPTDIIHDVTSSLVNAQKKAWEQVFSQQHWTIPRPHSRLRDLHLQVRHASDAPPSVTANCQTDAEITATKGVSKCSDDEVGQTMPHLFQRWWWNRPNEEL